MATFEQVEQTIATLIGRLHDIDRSQRSRLPTRRLIETTCPDLDTSWYAKWSDDTVGEIVRGTPDQRPDIRIKVHSDDLLALAGGTLDFRSAWQDGRVKLDASMTDLLRLRTAL